MSHRKDSRFQSREVKEVWQSLLRYLFPQTLYGTGSLENFHAFEF